jgi:hypothetical protein
MSDTPATTLYTALLAAQRAMGPVKKDARNPAFKSSYASLKSVLDTIDGPLSDNGIVMVQRFQPDNGEAILVTELIHAESGERLSSAVRVVGANPTDPQKMGSAITYYRRYSLLALLGLTPEDEHDDDGNAASKPAPPRQQPAPSGNRIAYNDPRHTTQYAPREAYRREMAARKEIDPEELAADEEDAPAPSRLGPVTWHEVWLEAKNQDIHDQATLAKAIGAKNTAAMNPGDILTLLKDRKPTPTMLPTAGHAG